MRIVKEHDERMNEILDTAAYLFSQKGYDKCSVNEIINTIGIAKGTFYHYFTSKEEVLDAIIDRATQLVISNVETVVACNDLEPEEKLLRIFLSMRIENEMEPGLLEEMHRPENALMHQKSLNAVVKAITPMLVQTVEEGIRLSRFQTEYPEQYMQIFMVSAITLMDDGMFQLEEDKKQEMFMALITLLGSMLQIPEDIMKAKAMQYFAESTDDKEKEEK